MTRPPRRPHGPAGSTGRIAGAVAVQELPSPVDDDARPFNPLDTENLANAVANALLKKKARLLGNLPVFRGAGIYAIYYRGDFPLYARISAENQDSDYPRWPIYIGKAIPAGGRRGAFNLQATDTLSLSARLRQHAESIRAAENLDIADFACRFLVVHDLWIPLSERLLLTYFAPVWNLLIDGFGNQTIRVRVGTPGSGRAGMCFTLAGTGQTASNQGPSQPPTLRGRSPSISKARRSRPW